MKKIIYGYNELNVIPPIMEEVEYKLSNIPGIEVNQVVGGLFNDIIEEVAKDIDNTIKLIVTHFDNGFDSENVSENNLSEFLRKLKETKDDPSNIPAVYFVDSTSSYSNEYYEYVVDTMKEFKIPGELFFVVANSPKVRQKNEQKLIRKICSYTLNS